MTAQSMCATVLAEIERHLAELRDAKRSVPVGALIGGPPFITGCISPTKTKEVENMSIKLEAKRQTVISEGRHTATISKIVEAFRGAGNFHYIDVFFKLDDADVELKYGCPASVSETSKLGKLLIAAGNKFEVGTMVDIEQSLIGKRFALMTMNKKGEKSDFEFAEVVVDSIKPLGSS
jgi:hypothetical protein